MFKFVRFLDHVHGNADKAKEAATEHYQRNAYVSTSKLEIVKASEITASVVEHFTFVPRLIEYGNQELPTSLPPYLLGLWLGDGHSDGSSITTVDDVTIKYLRDVAEDLQMTLRQYKITFFFTGDKELGTPNRLLKSLRSFDLLKNKHIPLAYLENSVANRLELLAGLIDSDGYLGKPFTCYEITQKNVRLAEDIAALATGLGFYCRTVDCNKCATNTDNKIMRAYKRMTINLNSFTPVIPVRIERKKLNDILKKNTRGTPMYLEVALKGRYEKWTAAQEAHFWNVVSMYEIPSGGKFAWRRMAENEVILKGFSRGSMKYIYDKGPPPLVLATVCNDDCHANIVNANI